MIATEILIAEECYTHTNWSFKNIVTNYSRVYYILGGEAYFRDIDSNTTVRLKKDHFYLFPSGKRFDLWENENDKLFHTYLHAFIEPGISEFIEISLRNNPFLKDCIVLLRKYIHSGDNDLLCSILNLILSQISYVPKERKTLAFKIKSYIDAHLEEKITLDLLSKKFSYSKAQINRVFIKEMNFSPIKYYNDKRLNKALQCLLAKMPINVIVDKYNYASSAAFSKLFKQTYGSSPTKYIQTLKDYK